MDAPGYIFIKQLGKGNFGTVNLVKNGEDLIAVKYIALPENEKVRESMIREAENLKILSNPCSPNVVCSYGSRVIHNTLLIEMEYIDGVTFLNYFEKLYKNLDRDIYLKLCTAALTDITKGIKYIHSKGIIHRDIKPDNILITGKTTIQIQAKIVDIGLGCNPITLCQNKSVFTNISNQDIFDKENKGQETKCCKGGAGTFLYSAPEVIIQKISYYASDMFSLAATMYRIITLENIYPLHISTAEQLKEFMKTEEYPKLKISNTHNTLKTLNTHNTHNKLSLIVNNLLSRNFLLRYTADQVLELLNSHSY